MYVLKQKNCPVFYKEIKAYFLQGDSHLKNGKRISPSFLRNFRGARYALFSGVCLALSTRTSTVGNTNILSRMNWQTTSQSCNRPLVGIVLGFIVGT